MNRLKRLEEEIAGIRAPIQYQWVEPGETVLEADGVTYIAWEGGAPDLPLHHALDLSETSQSIEREIADIIGALKGMGFTDEEIAARLAQAEKDEGKPEERRADELVFLGKRR